MDSITAIYTIRNSLRTNLTDPYTLTSPAGTRVGLNWIFALEPVTTPKYPMVEVKKLDNPTEVIDIGPDYMESEQVFMNIFFYTKNGFKITVSGTTYQNEGMVEYYLGQIKTTLKAQYNALQTSGIGSYKHIVASNPEYDPDTQLYFGFVTIRVRFYHT